MIKIKLFTHISLILAIFSGSYEGLCQAGNPDSCLIILDFNVWSGLDYDGFFNMGEYEVPAVREKRYQALIRQIKDLDPDVIGIHEANKLPEYAVRLANDIGYEQFYHVGVGGVRLGPVGLPRNLREGDAVLIKKYLNPRFIQRKQLSGGYVGEWASVNFTDATQIIAVKITYRGTPFFIFTTHWHSSLPDEPRIHDMLSRISDSGKIQNDELQDIQLKIKEGVEWRLSESRQTVDFIRDIAKDNYFILTGDFNAEPGSQEIDNLLINDMTDLFKKANPDSSGFTWDPATNLNIRSHYINKPNSSDDIDAYEKLVNFYDSIPRRIDYIFAGPSSALDSGNIFINSSRVVMKEIIGGVHASDHYGITASVRIR